MKSLVEHKIKNYEDSAWKFKIGLKSIVVRDQTEKFVNAIMFAKSFVDSTVASDPHVALAWTGLLVIPSKQRTVQSKGLSEVADLIRHYSILEKVYRGKQAADTINQDFKDDFEDKLSLLYSQILEYQAQTICQISKNVLLRSFTLPSTWESLLTNIKESDTVCRAKAGLLSDFRLNEVRIETQQLRQYLERRFEELEASTLRENIRQWLLPPHLQVGEDGVTAHDRHCIDREVGTCQWYLGGTHFLEWLQSGSQVLWLHGDVGCGKTVMCAAIIEKLKHIAMCQEVYRAALDAIEIPRASIAYFYFSFDSSAIQDPNYFLRALIGQLCLGDTIHPQLAETYRNTRGWAPSYDNLYQTLVSAVVSDEEAQFVSNIGSVFDTKAVFLVLDGLDEIPKDRDKTFRLIRNLLLLESSRLRIIITSRWQSSIDATLQRATMVTQYEIPRMEVERDIKSYLITQIADDSRFSLPVQERICERLSDGGVFRLAALQLQVLLQYPLASLNLQHLEKILKTLPKKLAECYDRILENIPREPEELRPCFYRALQWIALSQRPLYIEEVAEACMINSNRKSIDKSRFITSLDLVNNLLGLVRIEPPIQESVQSAPSPGVHTLSLAHFSVQEYLIFYEGFSQRPGIGSFDAALAHTSIAQSCFIYLCECNLSWMETWPLKKYAWNYWAAHIQAVISCLQGIHIQPDALRLFNEVAFPLLYFKLYDESRFSTNSWLATYKEIRNCLPSRLHDDIWKVLKDPTFPEDSISLFRDGREYQGFKPPKVVPEDCIEAAPIQLLTREKIPGTFYQTQQWTKLKHTALLPDPLAIRLVVVLPSSDKHSVIECHLCSDSLHNKLKYTALAYSWALNNMSYGIIVNGQSFYVGENLFNALRNLRDWREPRVFWIDAICINMSDLTERSSQVRLMTEVYGSAEGVCVWLGVDNHEYNEYEMLPGQFITPRLAHLEDFSHAITQYRKYISKGETTLGISHLSPLWRQAMKKVLGSIRDTQYKRRRGNWFWKGNVIFEQRFWRSCWIVQEVVVASKVTVHLGSRTIDWEDIPGVRGFHEFLEAPTMDLVRYQKIGDTRITGGRPSASPFHLGWAAVETLQQLRKRYQSGQELTLPELLNLTRYNYSSDGRDKIFAIFSILSEHEKNHKLLQPDYSLSVSDIFTRAAEYILKRYNNLDILSVCHGIPGTYEWAINKPRSDREVSMIQNQNQNRKSDFRSWVPDWTADSGLPMAPGVFSPTQLALFNAGDSSCYFKLDARDQMRALTVKGVTIDRIGAISHMDPDFDLQKLVIPEAHSHALLSRHLDPTLYPPNQTLVEVFWRTILTDRWISEKGDVSRLPPDYSQFLENITWKHWDLVETAKHRLQNDLLCMSSSISEAGRSLMVPWDVEAGDIIVVLNGGKVPFVLRKREDLEGEYYQLVGECYVHGMMDGEALHESEDKFQEYTLI
ncbi:hypothetical protein N431DRAFT_471571 [Stipitochalara longipes BDJ]|nr:hypothetical protein N431DRAFT_471571 [Stipitochalara longipes BDJ]